MEETVPVDLRRALRPLAASTWVVTSAHEGTPVGFTAISVTQASVDPPLLTFTVGRRSSSLAALEASRRYAVHLLAAGQEDAALRFAADAALRFADASTWSWGPDGLPVLDGVAARLAGDVVSMTGTGDSWLVLCAVGSAETADRLPLVYHARSYHGLVLPEPGS